MIPVVTVEEMAAIDAAAAEHTATEVLIERAGRAAALSILRHLGRGYGKRALLIAGKGHNGDDGRHAAAHLSKAGMHVVQVSPSTVSGRIEGFDLVIDAAFGTGFRGSYEAPVVERGATVVAVDIPSGVEGNTGRAAGAPMPADWTVTFAALKPGLLQGEGRRLAGGIELADIGLDTSRARIHLVEDDDVFELLPSRPPEAHKWSTAVCVVAGSPGMLGAARLCSRGASRAGAGMVRLCMPGVSPAELPVEEAVSTALPVSSFSKDVLDVAERCRAVVIGPGLGRSSSISAGVKEIVANSPVAVVVDADGLFALGDLAEASAVCSSSRQQTILTPHDGEYKRLMGKDPGIDRISAARELAYRTGAIVLLKGWTTVVADPGGEALVVTSGSARLATAGTGDVLSGMVGAFLARGVPPLLSAGLAAHVHGRSAGLGFAEGLISLDLPDLVASWLSTARSSSRSPVVPSGGVLSAVGVPTVLIDHEQHKA